jgi:predicted RNA-binding protein with PUA domain
MKNNNSQSKDDERLIKILNRIGRMYSDVRPGFAERIKKQIPENLVPRQHSPRSMKDIINMRIGKLAAAVILVGEIILLLSLLGGVNLADEASTQGRILAKRYLGPVKENWSILADYLERYGYSIESGRKIVECKTKAQEYTSRVQRKLKPKTIEPRHKETQDDIDAKGLVAVVDEREAGPGRPLDQKQSAEWSQLKTDKVQDSIMESNEQAVIDALKAFGRITGTYPSELSILTVMKEFRSAYKTKKTGKTIPNQILADKTRKLERLCEIYEQMLKKGKEPAYHGDKVEPGNENAILMRWRLVTGEYRVIFANLQTGTVTAEQLELLEAELSK